MPRKTIKKTTKVEKVEIPKGIPPKPREKLTSGQELYCYYPPNNEYHKRIYVKDYKGDWVLTKDDNGKEWIVNIEHLHSTILTKEEYEKLGSMDSKCSY